jgi:hypothetical protein
MMKALFLSSMICVACGAGLVGAADPTDRIYDVRVVLSSTNTWYGIRFKPGTGEAWQCTNMKWQKIKDAEQLPLSVYDVTMHGDGQAGMICVRIDTKSGKTWDLDAGEWKLVAEPD